MKDLRNAIRQKKITRDKCTGEGLQLPPSLVASLFVSTSEFNLPFQNVPTLFDLTRRFPFFTLIIRHHLLITPSHSWTQEALGGQESNVSTNVLRLAWRGCAFLSIPDSSPVFSRRGATMRTRASSTRRLGWVRGYENRKNNNKNNNERTKEQTQNCATSFLSP